MALGQQPTSGEVEIEYLFTVGESIEFGEAGYILTPRSLTTDQNGLIYVSEHQGRQVQQYTANGEYIRSFGRAGMGPGEFNQLAAIAIDSENRLMVLDRFQFKVSRFDTETGDVEEHRFEEMSQINMMTLVPLADDLFAGIYMETGPNLSNLVEMRAIRIYRFGEGEKESSVYEIFNHQFDSGIELERSLGTGIGHQLIGLSDNELVVGHRLYRGKHYIVDRETGNVRTFENDRLLPPFIHKMDLDDRPTEGERRFAGSITSFGSMGNFYYQILKMSLLMGVIDDELYHFYRENEKEGYGFSDHVEIFSQDGLLLYHGEVNVPNRSKEKPEFRHYLHIDEQGRLFVLDRYEMDDPKIRVYQIRMS